MHHVRMSYTYGEWLGRVLVSDLPGQQDGVLHGCLYSEVGGKNYSTKDKNKTNINMIPGSSNPSTERKVRPYLCIIR